MKPGSIRLLATWWHLHRGLRVLLCRRRTLPELQTLSAPTIKIINISLGALVPQACLTYHLNTEISGGVFGERYVYCGVVQAPWGDYVVEGPLDRT